MALTKVTSGVRTLAANEVATSNIADNAVTLAKMAHGTDGNLITFDAAGAPAAVATGSAGQLLTSAGAGAAPTFQTVASNVMVQRVVTEVSSVIASSVVTPFDSTIPQIGEGTEVGTRAITPTSASNYLEIEAIANLTGQGSAADYQVMALFVDSTADALAATAQNSVSYNIPTSPLRLFHRISAGSTSARTYKIRIGAPSGVVAINQSYGSGITLGGIPRFYLIVTEIAA